MKEIIAVINRKGGVGKTTTCDAIGAGLTNKGYKVLYIDLDPQSNLSSSLNVNTNYGIEKTICYEWNIYRRNSSLNRT